jgi:hypothetical protein
VHHRGPADATVPGEGEDPEAVRGDPRAFSMHLLSLGAWSSQRHLLILGAWRHRGERKRKTCLHMHL